MEFKKNENGTEVATISKEDYEKLIENAKQEGANGVKNRYEKYVAPSKYADLEKQVEALKGEATARDLADKVKDIYIANGGNAKFFKAYYSNAGIDFSKTEDIAKAIEESKEANNIFFNNSNGNPQGTNFANEMGMNPQDSEPVVNDGNSYNLSQRLHNK